LRLRSLAFLLPLALYVASAYHDVMYWDIGEMDTVPYILGIAHPPGLPLYTLIGWLFTHLFPIGSVAFRMSVVSALGMSLAAWVVAAIVADETQNDAAGVGAALLFATGSVAWAHATRAEAHALVVPATLLYAMYLLRWVRSGRNRDLSIAAIAFGCAVAVHPIALAAGGAAIVAIVVRTADDLPWRTLAAASGLCVAIAAASYAYLPLRSAWIDAHHAEPLARYGLTGSAFWNYDDPATRSGFETLISGRRVGVGGVRFGMTNDQFIAGFVHLAASLYSELLPFALVAGSIGIAVFALRNGTRALIMLLALVPGSLFACAFGAESDPDRYFLPLFALFCAGVGFVASVPARRFASVGVSVLTAIALVAVNRGFFHQPFDDRAAVEVRDVLAHTPSHAIVIATWVMAPPLAYSSYVEHRAGDRAIVPGWYGEAEDQIPGWTARYPVFVSGTPEGSVAGFHLERVPSITELYRVVRDSS
jgi:hypothetical protein